jgi:hypothetical protein
MLRCQMRVVQTQRDGKLHVERTVVRVLDHIARATQMQLSDVIGGDDDSASE